MDENMVTPKRERAVNKDNQNISPNKKFALRKIKKTFRKSLQNNPLIYMIVAALVLIGLIVLVVFTSRNCARQREIISESFAEMETQTKSPAEIAASKAAMESKAAEDEIETMLDSYGDIAIVQLQDEGGYLFMRQQPDESAERIGKLFSNAAVSILAPEASASNWYNTEEWSLVKSGGFSGYVKSEYLLTGDAARELARTLLAERAIIRADALSVRKEPSTESDRVATVYHDERYVILGERDGWYQIEKGYISAEYSEKKICLDEAIRLIDVLDKDTALNMYTNLGMSNIENGHINIRAEAGTNSKITGMLMPDCAVDILETEGDWYYIKSGPVKGYVNSKFITTGPEARSIALEKAQLMAIANTDGVNVRTEPNTDCEVWTTIVSAERYPIIGDVNDEWVQIDLGDTDENGEAMTAYVAKQYVNVRYALNEAFAYSEQELLIANSDSRRSSIVQYALQFVGNRYVWGGTSLTNGCDCSGFTQSVLAHFDVYIPRVSRDQAKSGRKITSDEMRPGDLIFYANKSGTINHVTMYIGGGRIVGAQSTRSGIKTAAWNYRTPVKIVNVMGD